jgi:hypothetical protein
MTTGLAADLSRLLGADAVVFDMTEYLHDSTEMQGLRGWADAVALPASLDQVQELALVL